MSSYRPAVTTLTPQHQDWVAELECGHTQHMRHQPPWTMRPWVLTQEGRDGFVGTAIPCPLCDRGAPGRT